MPDPVGNQSASFGWLNTEISKNSTCPRSVVGEQPVEDLKDSGRTETVETFGLQGLLGAAGQRWSTPVHWIYAALGDKPLYRAIHPEGIERKQVD